MSTVTTSNKVEVFVNGQPLTTGAGSVAELVAAQVVPGGRVATAVNGHFVSEAQRATTALKPGDRVEIVSPRQGG